MAGYVFAIGGDLNPVEVIQACVEKGVYSTQLNSLSVIPFEGTMADYLSMKPGDNVYFFCKRKYYGIGELVSVGPDCKYCNFPGASKISQSTYNKDELLVDFGQASSMCRWICTFKGSPYFFEDGIDTDEILVYKPHLFRMLRAFWKVSFIKLDEDENQALKEIFLLRHQKELREGTGIITGTDDTHKSLVSRNLDNYRISPEEMLACCTSGEKVKHEMALEAAVVYDLSNSKIPGLGDWDYVSHQVIASPFKPVDYMDKMDVFGIRYLEGTKIPCKYMVIELKKDNADFDTVDQVLKYVDWVCDEYAYGDYEAIESCIIAASYPPNIDDYYKEVVQRYYTLGSHPVRNKQWGSLKLYKYKYLDGQIKYYDVTPEYEVLAATRI